MKSDKLHKIAFLGLFTLLAAVPVLQSCDDDEKQKAVDLRYRVEDSYLLPADGTTDEPVSYTHLTLPTKLEV